MCKGTGEIEKTTNYLIHHQHGEITMKKTCDNCKGDGYLDWVENIVGKEMSDQQKKKNKELTKFLKKVILK